MSKDTFLDNLVTTTSSVALSMNILQKRKD